MLGLIREGEGIAAGVLESQGVKLDQARTEVIRAIGQLRDETDTVPSIAPEAAMLLAEEETGLTCTHCGARSPQLLPPLLQLWSTVEPEIEDFASSLVRLPKPQPNGSWPWYANIGLSKTGCIGDGM